MNAKKLIFEAPYLGPHETRLLLTLEKEKKFFFTFEDAVKILSNVKRPVIRNTLSRLQKKNRIKRIERGRYLFSPLKSGVEGYWREHEFLIPSYLLPEYYISFWTALSYWGMTEQIPRTVFICTLKRRKSIEFAGTKFKFVTLSHRYFFGFIGISINGRNVQIASREKTILDCLLHPEYSGGIVEVIKGINSVKNEIRWELLREYLYRMKNSAVSRRLGYCLYHLRVENELLKELEDKHYVDFRWLDPSRPKKDFVYNTKFGLKLNIPDEQLNAEIL